MQQMRYENVLQFVSINIYSLIIPKLEQKHETKQIDTPKMYLQWIFI